MESVHLLLKWKHQFQFAGYYAAIKEGYYREAGLRVQLIEPTGETPAIKPLLSGRADFAIMGTEVIVQRANGFPLMVLASIFQHSPHIFLTREDSGIKKLQDFSGKKVMMDKDSLDLLALLHLENVPPASIQLLEHNHSINSLIDGSVDVLAAYSSNEPFLLQRAGIDTVAFYPQHTGVDFYGDSIVTTEAYLKKNPRTVDAFLAASLKGWHYALEHPDELIDWMLANYRIESSKASLEHEARAIVALLDHTLVDLGHINPDRWERITTMAQRLGIIDEHGFEVDTMLYQSPGYAFGAKAIQLLALASIAIASLTVFALYQRKQKKRLQREIKLRRASQKQLIRREREYRDFFQDAPLAFIIWDLDLKVKAWNNTAEKIFGWSRAEVIGKDAQDFLVPESAKADVDAARETLNDGQMHTLINENLKKDGKQIWCRWYNVPRKNAQGKVYEFQSIAQDISLDLAERNDLEQKAQRIQQNNQAKDEIIAQTSHEIRNPLNAILGYAEILNGDTDDPETKEMTAHIISGTESMLQLLNDLLDSSKMQAGKMQLHLEAVELRQLVRQRCEFHRALIESHAVELEILVPDQACSLITDQHRVGQIITNLLSNAAKFTETGKITVCLQQLNAAEPFAFRIDVTDTGIGMSPETCQRIFTPFTQANNKTSRKYGGSGLGISLSYQLATVLEGELTVESKIRQGSCFSLFLKSKTRA